MMSTAALRRLRPSAGTCLVVLAFLAAGPAHAGMISLTTSDGQGADAFILDGSSSADNFGDEQFVGVKNSPGGAGSGFNRKGYFRFDLGDVVPASVTSATFSLALDGVGGGAVAPNPMTFNVFGLNDGFSGDTTSLGEDWGELDINWNNAPANALDSANGVIGTLATLLGTFDIDTLAAPGTIFDFTSADLVSFLNDDGNALATLIVTSETVSEPVVRFASRENADFAAPTLTLNVQPTANPVPEPSSLALLGIGLAGFSAVRRSRERSRR